MISAMISSLRRNLLSSASTLRSLCPKTREGERPISHSASLFEEGLLPLVKLGRMDPLSVADFRDRFSFQ